MGIDRYGRVYHGKSRSEVVACGSLTDEVITRDVEMQALNYPLKSMIFFRAMLLALTHLWAQFSPEQP